MPNPDQMPTFLASLEREVAADSPSAGGDVVQTVIVTRRVPLLPGVRVPCRGECRAESRKEQAEQVVSRDRVYHHPSCPGWTASDRLEVWLEALLTLDGIEYLVVDKDGNTVSVGIVEARVPDDQRIVGEGATSLEALLAALAEALRPLACNWDAAEAMGRAT